MGDRRSRAEESADLDDDLHEVLLGDNVLAVDDLLEHARQDEALVHAEVDALELAEADEVGADEDAKLLALHLTLLALARVARVLQADPELIHLDEVGQDEADRVLKVAGGTAERGTKAPSRSGDGRA